MRLLLVPTLLASLATLAAAAPSSEIALHHNANKYPCDLSSEDTNCYLIMDNSGCFLNTSNVTRVLGCVDPNPKVAIDIFCRCWGCNGKELENFIPTLHCAGSNATNTNGTAKAANATAPTVKLPTHMPIPVLPRH